MEKNSDPDSGIEISLIWDQEFGKHSGSAALVFYALCMSLLNFKLFFTKACIDGGGGREGTGKSKFFLFRITYLRIQKPKKYLRIPNTVVV
jgi:hypothetical protein